MWQAQADVNCTSTGAGRFANPDDITCQNYTLCTYISSTDSYVATDYFCPSSSVFNTNTSQCTNSSNYVCNVSVCTAEAYFADPSSTNCSSYIECISINDTYTETTYTCPDNTLYNPNTTLCEGDYNCTDSTSSSTVNSTTNTTSSTCTADGYYADQSSTNCSSYIECIFVDDTYIETTYDCPNDTLFNPNTTLCDSNYNCTDSSDSNSTASETFNCTTAGRFANPEDTTCQTYYMCVLLSNGSYLQYEYTCPTSAVFDPDSAYCTSSSNYVCNVTTTTNSTNTTSSVCTDEGYFADPSSTNCSSYIECILINDTYTETTYTCPGDTLFNSNTTLCVSDYNCTDISDSDSTDSNNSSFSCTTAGRFANPDDTTCETYYMCVLASNGSYVQFEYTCPTSAVFNPNTAYCTSSSNYVCNVTSSNTASSSVCTADGYVTDPSSANCSTYIECVEIDGTYSETTYICPESTNYNPNTTLCDSDYNCTDSSNSTDSAFSCTAAGRFANTADTTCQTYYFCVSYNNGTYALYEYTCPSTSVFNPTSQVCTTTYICTGSG